MSTALMPTGESRDLRVVQSNLTFQILYPSLLIENTYIVSGRWWGDGNVVELHYRSDDPSLPMRGPITVKEWTEAGVSAPAAGRPGRNPDAQIQTVNGINWWVFTNGEFTLIEGVVGDLNIQTCSIFKGDVALEITASLAG